ncbi:MAG: protoporphyrinogen oxidase [Myxococcales bacterium]|nr:protoporphyrinogen oxidase [Myxococcales bacterium]
MSQAEPFRVVIVGGGLSGLTAAWALSRAARQSPRPLAVTVLEGASRLGGNLITERIGELQIDGGPDGWVAAKRDGETLCRELGLGDALVETQRENRKVYMVHRGALTPTPEGIVLGVPTRVGPVLRSPMLSPLGKARMLLDRVLPRRVAAGDVSLGALVADRLGSEVVEAFTSPLLAGVYAGDAWQLSARSTFPQLVKMAATQPSLLLAAREAAPRRHPGAPPPSAFVSLRGGTGSLIDALAAQLAPGTVRRDTPVRAITREGARYRVSTHDGAIDADAVMLALPAHRSARIVEDLDPAVARALSAIGYGSAATVFFALPRAAVKHPMDATGFVVPRREGFDILASTFVSAKWPHRAPRDTALIRVFVGGTAHAEHLGLSDAALTAMGWRALKRLITVDAEPSFTKVYRFIDTSPQPTVGHRARVEQIADALAPHRGLYLLGSAYEGVGIPDVIGLARRSAARLIAEGASR